MANVDKFSDELDKLIAETENYLDDLEKLLGTSPERQESTAKQTKTLHDSLPDDGL